MSLEYVARVQAFIDYYELNIVNTYFLFATFLTAALAFSAILAEHHTSAIISQCFRYGKFNYKGKPNPILSFLEIPKSSFKHFYILAIIYAIVTLILTIKVFVYGSQAPDAVIRFLDFFGGGKNRQAIVSSTSSLIGIVLLSIQVARRFYETQFIQIFSSKGKINITHYIAGHLHYPGVFIALLTNTEGFVRGTTPSAFSLSKITLIQFICCFIFHFAWSQQYKSNMILVNLRKDESGRIMTEKHFIPRGGFFELISSPHMFFEVAMYASIAAILRPSSSLLYVLAWVGMNQISGAWLTHKWYQETYKNYPKDRYAIFPQVL